MNHLKKIGLLLVGIVIILGINFSAAIKVDMGGKEREVYTGSEPTVDNQIIEGTISEGSSAFSEDLHGIIITDEPENYSTSLGRVMSLIQITINWLLGILAFIALVYMLYCGFLIVSSGSEDNNSSKGKKGITTAAIALAGIGLSWLVISAMIRFIDNISKSN